MKNIFKNIGPGTLVAAAFIGPGTVTLCTIAGVRFSFDLLWALLLSVIATIVLQEMAARVGIVTDRGLAENIRTAIQSKLLRNLAIALIICAVMVGNAAYEAGNISGAVLGLQGIFGGEQKTLWILIIGGIAGILLFIGNYKVLEKVLIVLVLVMSVSFVITAVMTRPDWYELTKGLLIPRLPSESLLTVVGLIGTTVVPYNLFLHASIVRERWKGAENLGKARQDAFISILLGGLVSMAIVVTASGIGSEAVTGIMDLAAGLEPLYGSIAVVFLGVGLFAAGITSAITAPLAAAYVARNCFGWTPDLKDSRFRLVWFVILALGMSFSSLEFSPIEVIKFAQITNGLLLPVIGLFLLWLVNRSSHLGNYVNNTFQNVLGIIILLITFGLGLSSILKVLNVI